MTANIIGLDLSLTATGMAMVDGVEVYKPKASGVQRLALIRDWVLAGVGRRSRIAIVEGYAFGRPNQAHH
ncbi:MAG TPA: hypothetical protein VMY34_03925, partial [Acidimicrobiales bacterium]|nr:hypothetical protein [Acidimicrobiales bacterium]